MLVSTFDSRTTHKPRYPLVLDEKRASKTEFRASKRLWPLWMFQWRNLTPTNGMSSERKSHIPDKVHTKTRDRKSVRCRPIRCTPGSDWIRWLVLRSVASTHIITKQLLKICELSSDFGHLIYFIARREHCEFNPIRYMISSPDTTNVKIYVSMDSLATWLKE